MPAIEAVPAGKVYVDTSALVAMITAEPRSASLKAWLRSNQGQALVSADWCVPEVASALSIKVRSGQIDVAIADEAWSEFGAACDGLLDLMPVVPGDFSFAAQMCRGVPSGLRAGDALHLAVAVRTECAAMLCFDTTLNRNAQASGLAVISP